MLLRWRQAYPDVVETAADLGAADALWFEDEHVMVWGDGLERAQRDLVLTDMFPELLPVVPGQRAS